MIYTITLGLILLLSCAVVIGNILLEAVFGEVPDILDLVGLVVFIALNLSLVLILGLSLYLDPECGIGDFLTTACGHRTGHT